MTIFQSIILGVIEGFTEFLPISSTGHLVLTSYLLKLEQSNFLKSFEIAIQLGAIFGVVALYFKRFLLNPDVIKKIIVAFLPTAVIGFLFYGLIKNIFLGSESLVVWSLFFGGLALIVFEFWYRGRERTGEIDVDSVSYKQCFIIGLFQAISVIPGVSRAGATILGGLWLGIPRKTIVEFSFLLAIPTMAGATGLDLIKNFSSFSDGQTTIMAVGFAISLATALISIKFLLHFIQKNTFVPFGIYRIILAVVFLLFLM